MTFTGLPSYGIEAWDKIRHREFWNDIYNPENNNDSNNVKILQFNLYNFNSNDQMDTAST